MDDTDASYVVGWVMSGEVEVKASTPEQAIRRAKAKMRSVAKPHGEMKVSTLKAEFAIPNDHS
jgi:hypothetical protein